MASHMLTSLMSLNWFIQILLLFLLVTPPIMRDSPIINAVHLTFQVLLALQVQPHQEEGKHKENRAESIQSRKRQGQ